MTGWQFHLTCPYDGAPVEHAASGATNGWETRAVGRCTECGTRLLLAVTVAVGDRHRPLPMMNCSPHQCPHCRCLSDAVDDMGDVDTSAPFHDLVMEIASLDGVDPRGIKLGGRYTARGAWRRSVPSPSTGESAATPLALCPSTGNSQAEIETINA